MQTVETILRSNNGVGPGFDWCRIGLSVSVILLHSFHTSYGVQEGGLLIPKMFNPFFAATLPMFFGLSGFLVTGSAIRLKDTKTFLLFRVLRIVPALAVEVTLCALIIGPLLSVLPVREYFSDPMVFHYFGNIVGRIHYNLPGVFLTNPSAGMVNVNLWTLHPELVCYAAMAVLMVSGIAYQRLLISGLWLGLTVAMAIYNYQTAEFELHGVYGRSMLIYYFITGCVAFHWRDCIPISGSIFATAGGLAYLLLTLPQTAFVCQVPIMYVIIWLGMQRLPDKFIKTGDYSYGLYLYGYPIQQTTVYFGFREWWMVFPLATTLALVFSVFSWHLIEKNALKLKRIFISRPKSSVLAVGASISQTFPPKESRDSDSLT